MRTRKAQKLALAKERLQTLTPAELTEVSGGNGHDHHHDHHHHHHHRRQPPGTSRVVVAQVLRAEAQGLRAEERGRICHQLPP